MPKPLSPADVAPLLGMHVNTLYRLLIARERGDRTVSLPPAYRVGGKRGQWRFPVTPLYAWLSRLHGTKAIGGSERRGATVRGAGPAARSGVRGGARRGRRT